jgi:hypothetical protein
MTTFIPAKKLAILDGLMKPDMIAIGDGHIYITEGVSIYIYSLKDYHLIKKFGKDGEGPQEFKISPFGPPMVATPYQDKIYVSSFAKLSVFTNDGEYIKESKIMPFSVCAPFGNQFVATATGTDAKNQQVVSINLYNEKFEKLKELYISDLQVGPSFSFKFPLNSFNYLSYKDRLYVVAGKEGFVINVFDEQGTWLYRVKKDEKPLEVADAYKKQTLDWFQNAPNYKQAWEFMKNRISFRDFYPAIRKMMVTDDRIYILTYKQQDDQTECILMDLKGNEQKRIFLPCPENLGMDYHPKYGIYQRNFYSLVENEEEAWELHVTEIK